MKIAVQTEAFDLGAEVDAMSKGRTDIGAIASFVGLARDLNEGSGVTAMTLEHYPGMTEKALAALVDEANTRWTLLDVTVIHRVGRLLPGDPIVMVAVASEHRGEAFAACEPRIPENPRAVLEKGRDAGRRALGRGARQRRRGGGALGRAMIQNRP
jgi:molybdopterin synthase catalytic subunit